MPESALGRGLEALIQDSKSDEKEEKKNTPKKASKKKNTKKKNQKKTTTQKTTKKENIQTPQIALDDEKIQQIKEEVTNNPRISLWSLKSAAVLRYLKKTIPEFSISNEASIILDEAIADKYPEIWNLFEDME